MTPFRLSVLLLTISILTGCQPRSEPASTATTKDVRAVATEFFDTFAERSDWQKLLSFYSPEMTFEDVLLQARLESFEEFQKFYNWPDPNFEKLFPDQKHLVVETLATVDGRVAVARGHFNPFMWKGEKKEPAWGMEFTIWLFFDENLKIIRQIDWIEYDDLVLESVIKRIRERGLDSKPPGLDD